MDKFIGESINHHMAIDCKKVPVIAISLLNALHDGVETLMMSHRLL